MDLKQQILHLYRVDELSLREIARRTGTDRKTVTRLINAYEAAVKADPDTEADFHILRNTTAPAVLTENFFMDSHPDCAFLLSEEGQQSLVDLHVDGICAYLGISEDNLLNPVSQETFSRK